MEKYTRGRLILSTLFTLFYNVAFDIKTHYIQATCLYKLKLIKKLIKKSNIKLSGTSYLAELATKLLRSNITFTEEPTYYKNKSTIDRTVSLKNLLMVIKDFILIYIDVNIINKSQYKKFIKDVTEGTLERKELIEETIEKFLKNDINLKRTDKLLKIIIYAAVFELLYKHNNPKKVIISEYLKTSHFFLEEAQIKYLNAILDKLSDLIRKN